MNAHHGLCVPLFALGNHPTFLDLIPLIDWCKQIGFDCLQLLPLNDTGADPSPYNPISSCALHPRYLSLSEPHAQFEQTFPSLSQTPAYRTFLEENPWLPAYSRFKILKEPSPHGPDYYSFLQYHAFRQMEQVHEHATLRGISLKGDIPILLSRDSADVSAEPALFHLSLSAGAPPDPFNPLGQHWGFPLFDWDAMRRDHYRWWKQRLKVATRFYDIYRIDHVVGFFRIWGIPPGKKPSEGSFFPPDSALWAAQGKELLQMLIDATPLFPIAEDLGTIPPEVYPILKELGIPGTKVIRWQRRDGAYIPFDEYEPLSLTTLSTPDMDPLALWWRNTPAESVPFAAFMNLSYHPILTAPQRLQILRAAHHTSSLFHINLLQEYLALFPELVHPDPEQERINIPGTFCPTNWSYRFRPTLQEITTHKGLAEALRVILSK